MIATPEQDVQLFSYVIASADMRYIERTEREVHLVKRPDGTMFLRGEMPDCGPSAQVGLGHLLLEYAMSSEGCRDQTVIDEAIAHFGARLARVLAPHFPEVGSDPSNGGRAAAALDCILSSMGAQFSTTALPDQLEYRFEAGLLQQIAEASGMRRGLADAHRAFVMLCQNVLLNVAPQWELTEASPEAGALRLRRIA